ncbi:hypothetical protein L3Y34_016502 [Caenorhabditis briggsae]|uniref:Uncharacterized protein n=1 Tax=Caenorhabditis briggsae TaxID=6238 RepID=A0AAE9DYG5_CAEBR|nr:hypothetical protein L3Y34_016502 [Caenorhabditis briggsae]
MASGAPLVEWSGVVGLVGLCGRTLVEWSHRLTVKQIKERQEKIGFRDPKKEDVQRDGQNFVVKKGT